MREGHLRGSPPPTWTARQVDVLAAFVAAGGSVHDAAELVGIRPSTAKRHLADLRARSGLTTAQLIYVGRAAGWLVVPSLLRDWHLAEDALQHTLVTIWNELPRLRDPDQYRAVADRDQLERGFRRLRPEQRAVLVLHYYVGLSLAEIADVLGTPVGTAGSRLHYAVRALRAALEADERSTAPKERLA